MIPAALFGAGAVLAYLSNRGPTNLVSVRSETDGNTYQVQDLPDKQEACELISGVRGKLDKLVKHYKDDPSAMGDPRVKVLVERFNPASMYENNIDADSTSYSENKGEKIVVCVRDKAPPHKLVDENVVTFVLLHEMAHLMTTTIGHTPEFWTNFKRILHDASSIQIYTPQNYAKNPVDYCGMQITDSPL